MARLAASAGAGRAPATRGAVDRLALAQHRVEHDRAARRAGLRPALGC